MKKGERLSGGFTIIEVSLVLAIAGLIFLMVFVALPALQRSRRDNARRDDMSKFVTEVKRFQTNNRGNLPTISGNYGAVIDTTGNPEATSWAGFYKKYLGSGFADPNGTPYSLLVYNCKEGELDQPCKKDNGKIITEEVKEEDGNGMYGEGTYAYTLLVFEHAKCSDGDVVHSSSPRNVAVFYRLETAGYYCYDT